MGQVFYVTVSWPAWPTHICQPIWPMTHDPLTHWLLCMAKAFLILSVRLSVCQMRALWQNERNLCPHFYTIGNNAYHTFPTRRMVGGVAPCNWNFEVNWPSSGKNANFQFTFARSASAVTPREKSSINKNKKSTTRWAYKQCTLPLSPHSRAQKSKVTKIWTIICDNLETVRDRMSVTINNH